MSSKYASHPDCDHPGQHRSGINCPECHRFMAHGWVWTTYGPDGFYEAWGGICKQHGPQQDST